MISLLLTTLFFILFGIVHGLRIRELNEISETIRYQLSRKWHKIQAFMHVVFAFLVAIKFSFFAAIPAFFLVLTIIWIFFDLAHNLTTGQNWYYHENSGLNGWFKKRVREIGIIAIKVILFTSLIIIFIVL